MISNEGRLVIGGRGNTFNTDQSGVAQHIQKTAIHMYPQLAGVKWEYNWGGLVAITMDREPRIFELGPDAYAGLGYNGRGVPMATMMGKQLADLICGEDVPMPVEPVRPIIFHRFAQIGILWDPNNQHDIQYIDRGPLFSSKIRLYLFMSLR
jgi:glycine/D-amino acid oxidase-like deaminating enzyme